MVENDELEMEDTQEEKNKDTNNQEMSEKKKVNTY